MNPRKRLAEILARQGEIKAGITEVEGIEAPTAEDATRSADLLNEFDALEVERVEVAAVVARTDAVLSADVSHRQSGSFEAPQVMKRQDPFEDLMSLRYTSDRSPDLKSRALTAVESTFSPGTTDAERESAIRMIETVPGAAKLALANGSPAYRSAFETWFRAAGRGQDVVYSPEEAEAVRASMSLTSAAGGYALPFLLDPTLIHTGTATKQSLRSVARVISGTQNVWHGVSVGNATTYLVGENTALTDGTPTFAGPSVTAAKLTCYVTASYEIFEDSDLQAQLPGIIGESMGFAENTFFITGSGSAAPKGIVTCLSGTAGVTVTATTRGQFNTASAVDVFALLNAVPSRYESTATWIGNKATFNNIKQMSTASNGSYFWTDFNAAIGSPLLGSPILQSSDMASAQTSGTKILILGDFSQFVIYDRLGTTVEFVQNVVDGSGLPTGTRGLIAHKRVGSDVTDQNAFRVLNT